MNRALAAGLAGALLALVTVPSSAVGAGPEDGLDGRGWELVSPPLSGGGQLGRSVDPGAGAFQAAANGESLAFGSPSSFAGGAGAPPVSQYLAARTASGWGTANVSPPLLSGSYAGGAYQLFSTDLARSLLSNGWSCPDGTGECVAANAPLAAGAPAGHRTLYLHSDSGFQSLLTTANSPALTVSAEDFRLSLEGATPDLQHAVIATCAALTADATEVAAASGCDPAETNLYRWSGGTLSALNLLPGETATATGASLAAPAQAISTDGSRVFWSHDGDLYLRDGSTTKLVAADAEFQAASASGDLALYLKDGHLYLQRSAGGAPDDLTPSGGVVGTLAAFLTDPNVSGPYVYYLTGSGLFLARTEFVQIEIANGADLANTPPATGTAHISANGRRLAFVSSASLTGFPNAGKAEVYLYDAPSDQLRCVSCNPFGAAPLGPASLPGARAAGGGPSAYRPRALSPDGNRLFFDSVDRLVAADSDGSSDVYEWEAQGTGSCTAPAGCVGLISNGRVGTDTFLDASADGDDAFFLTPASLVGADRGGLDVYDARVGGGFSEFVPVVPCEGDACQGTAPGPSRLDPATATVEGPVNPPPRYIEEPQKTKKKAKKKGKRGAKKGKRNRSTGGRR